MLTDVCFLSRESLLVQFDSYRLIFDVVLQLVNSFQEKMLVAHTLLEVNTVRSTLLHQIVEHWVNFVGDVAVG